MDLSVSIPVLLTSPQLSKVVRVNEPDVVAAYLHLTTIGLTYNTTVQGALISATDGMLLLQSSKEGAKGLYYRTARCGDPSIAQIVYNMLFQVGWGSIVTPLQIGLWQRFAVECSPYPRLRFV